MKILQIGQTIIYTAADHLDPVFRCEMLWIASREPYLTDRPHLLSICARAMSYKPTYLTRQTADRVVYSSVLYLVGIQY